jgi:hypothetical protein
MHLPTRQQERTATAALAVGLIALTLAAGALVSPLLGGSIMFLGILAILVFVEVTNWLLARQRRSP